MDCQQLITTGGSEDVFWGGWLVVQRSKALTPEPGPPRYSFRHLVFESACDSALEMEVKIVTEL